MKNCRFEILVLCEESQAITKEFRKAGYEAYSCDIQECSGGHPEWHIQEDAIKVLNQLKEKECELIIAHPPCTYLSKAANAYYNRPGRKQKRIEAATFFMQIYYESIKKAKRVCCENPAGYLSTMFRKPDQYIQPYQFGEPFKKKTGLWLYNLPELKPTKIIKPEYEWVYHGSKDAKRRSKTFKGIAEAIADQWSQEIEGKTEKQLSIFNNTF